MPELLKKILTGSGIGLVIGFLIGWGSNIEGFFLKSLLDGYEYRSYDSRMKAKASGSEEGMIDDIVIIDIDQNSVDMLGNYHDWPHAHHGKLIDVVSSGNPQAIIFDIIFDPEITWSYDLMKETSKSISHNEMDLSQEIGRYLDVNDPVRFLNSTAASNKVFHSLLFEPEDSSVFKYKMGAEPEGYDYKKHILQISKDQVDHLPHADRLGNTHIELLSNSSGVGSANFPQDVDGLTRRSPTAIYFEGPGHVYPSLTLAAAMKLLDVPSDGLNYDFEQKILTLTNRHGEKVRKIPIDEKGRVYVNFSGTYKAFTYLPYSYCIDPDLLPPEYWEGKVVLVGTSLPGLMDLRNTPVQETFPGVEIHANVLYSILNNTFVNPMSHQSNFLVILAACIFIGMVVNLLSKPVWSIPIPLVSIAVWIIFTYDQFLSQLVMWEIIRPSLGMSITFVGMFIYNLTVAEKDKRFLKNTFGNYISPELIDQMYDDKQEPKLGGEAGYHTAWFSDIQSFSSFSEVLEPEKMVSLMNEYLTEMTDILLKQKGTLDKYIGDSIVAFWGAPVPVEDHEYLACMAALEMEEKLVELRVKWKSEDEWPEIVHHMQHRVGLSAGELVTGNMGSTMRMNYTMMGDMVNLGSRLESSAKQYGVYIQVEENLYEKVKDQFEWRTLDYVRVKGRTKPVHTYELLSEKGKLNDIYDELVPLFQQGIDHYLKQEWQKALKCFEASDKMEDMFPTRPTNPSRVYIERCKYFIENSPGKDWDSVWTLTKK